MAQHPHPDRLIAVSGPILPLLPKKAAPAARTSTIVSSRKMTSAVLDFAATEIP
jgi:hypothetical protein